MKRSINVQFSALKLQLKLKLQYSTNMERSVIHTRIDSGLCK